MSTEHSLKTVPHSGNIATLPNPQATLRGTTSTTRLWVELAFLFGVVPLLLTFRPPIVHPLLVLALACGGCLVVLARDADFEIRSLWSRQGVGVRLLSLLPLFAFSTVVLGVGLWLVQPEALLSFPRQHPAAWLAVMIAYPLISVVPQEIVYRAYFFHRYRTLFGAGWPMILASAAAFAWMHVLFRNYIAVALCAAGGVIFAWRYYRTGSLVLTSVEHMIYGQLIFTIGLGSYIMSDGGTVSGIAAR
jgi:membrane protease YdiL (CAAX protease family)